MTFFFKYVLFLCILGSLKAQAAFTGISIWRPIPQGSLLVLPLDEARSGVKVARSYVAMLSREAQSGALGLNPHQLDISKIPFDFSSNAFQTLPQKSEAFKAAALIANRIGQVIPTGPRARLREALMARGIQPFVIPLSLERLIEPTALLAYHQWVTTWFDGLIAQGGGDVCPEFYGEKDRGQCRDVFPRLDQTEIQLVKESLKSPYRQALFGICRGHQVLAIALGAKLIQDVESDLPQPYRHRAHVDPAEPCLPEALASKSAWHPLTWVDPTSLLAKLFSNRPIQVNSRHHQALGVKDALHLVGARSVGVSEDLVEAMELDADRGFSVQFHPEDMETPESSKVLDLMGFLIIKAHHLRMTLFK